MGEDNTLTVQERRARLDPHSHAGAQTGVKRRILLYLRFNREQEQHNQQVQYSSITYAARDVVVTTQWLKLSEAAGLCLNNI